MVVLLASRLPANTALADDQFAKCGSSLFHFEDDTIFFAAERVTRYIYRD
jgi:hypothetical protein